MKDFEEGGALVAGGSGGLGAAICQALIDKETGRYEIIPDFRSPHYLRFGFSPLYNSFPEIALCIAELKDILAKKLYSSYPDKIKGVT